MSDEHRFVSKAWLAPLPFALWALVVAAAGSQAAVLPDLHPAAFLVMAAALLLTAIHGWTASRPTKSRAHQRSTARGVALAQGALAGGAAVALAVAGYGGTAILCAGLGVMFLVVSWPSEWMLRQQAKELTRPYRADYFILLILSGLFLSGIAVFAVAVDLTAPESADAAPGWLASSGSMVGLMLALAMQSLILARDELRRPRHRATPLISASTPPY